MTHAPTTTTEAIDRLRAGLPGRVVTPDDADYDQLRAVVPGDVDIRPAAIIRVADAADVALVVNTARDTGVELSVRCGGHSAAGHGLTDGGLVIDVRDLRGLDIDVPARTAWAGSGLTAAEYTSAVGAHGLATGFGDTGSVGIGGITLGGGVGYLGRKYGLTIDSLLAAEIVTADGRVRIVDGIQNALPRTPRETEVAGALGWDRFTRLACQTRVSGDVSLERLITSCADVSRALVTDSSAAPPEEKPLAVLICDIRDFTPFVERHLAYDVLHILNRFFESVGDAVLMNNGVIYQYVGDQIIGLFGLGGDATGKSGFDAVNGGVAGSETIVEQIRKIRDDDSIKAIVVRVDSPGGSAVASDVIWRELKITRDEDPDRLLLGLAVRLDDLPRGAHAEELGDHVANVIRPGVRIGLDNRGTRSGAAGRPRVVRGTVLRVWAQVGEPYPSILRRKVNPRRLAVPRGGRRRTRGPPRASPCRCPGAGSAARPTTRCPPSERPGSSPRQSSGRRPTVRRARRPG